MPIEIKELIIKATINDDKQTDQDQNTGLSESEKKALVDQCVEKVLEIIKEKTER